jgi:hypothetical protein
MSVGTLVGSAGSAGAASCQPGTTQLIAAMSAQIPSTSPLWTQIQAALGQGGPGGNSTTAVMSVLNRNNYTYDCATNQVRDTSGAARPSAAGAGAATVDPGTTAPSAAVAGLPSTGKTVIGTAGAAQGGSAPPTTGGPTAAVGNLASNQPSTGSSGGGGDTLPIVIALVLSTLLVVFVAVRHFRKGTTTDVKG